MRIMPFMKRKKGVQFAGTGLDIGGGGTTDYTDLSNKPQIAGVTLTGNKTLADLGVQGALTFDSTPTENSSNPVTSGGVWSTINSNTTATELSITPSLGILKVVRVGKIVNVMWDTGVDLSTTIPTGMTTIASNLPRPYGFGVQGQGSNPKDIIVANGTDGQSYPTITFQVDYNGRFYVTNMSGNSFGDSHSGVNIVYITID